MNLSQWRAKSTTANSREQACSGGRRDHVWSRLMPIVGLIALANPSLAQEDPFAAAAAAKAAATKVEVPLGPAKREPLVIELLRASNFTTPEQLLAAAQAALQF